MHLLNGLQAPDLALLALRLALGGFFFLARFRWIYDPSKATLEWHALGGEPKRGNHPDGGRWFNAYRHEHLVWKLCACGYSRNAWLAGSVGLVEIFAGLGVVVGLLAPLAAFGLCMVTLFATLCTWRDKVAKQSPVDRVDWASCYLWLVEPHLIVMGFVIVACGAGRYSLDGLLLAWVQ